jgi:LPXTG-site transpeptidase (sortase) family protein
MKTHKFPIPKFYRKFISLPVILCLILILSPLTSVSADSPPFAGILAQANLKASDAGIADEFGYSTAISGDIIVVGAPHDDQLHGNEIISNAGAVYVFERLNSSWVQQAKLTPNTPHAEDNFGVSVAVDGNIIVVGAVGHDYGGKEDVGGVYIFARDGKNWKQEVILQPDDLRKEDYFGGAVAIDGNVILAGTTFHDSFGIPDVGAVYVFIGAKNNWFQQAKLIPTTPQFGGYFGASLDVDNNTLIIGATEAGNPLQNDVGSAYVFEKGAIGWTQVERLVPDDGRNGDFFGYSVSIEGDTIAVGASFKDPEYTGGRITSGGAVYIYGIGENGWAQEQMLALDSAAPFDYFGNAVDLYHDTLVVGASGKNGPGTLRSGMAFIYALKGQSWEQVSFMYPELADDDDNFGQAVAIDGSTILIGASGRDPSYYPEAGEAFVFELAETLPETGYAPDEMTTIPVQTASEQYNTMGELWLEISTLNVKMPIVSVPRGTQGWDVTWLWEKGGYLEETAFPTWPGNTAIAAHVYLPDGSMGPFVNLGELKWGDIITLHAWNQSYKYEVRSVLQTEPDDLSVLGHEDYDWLTLITCQGYDEESDTYQWRTVVRAVLQQVK